MTPKAFFQSLLRLPHFHLALSIEMKQFPILCDSVARLQRTSIYEGIYPPMIFKEKEKYEIHCIEFMQIHKQSKDDKVQSITIVISISTKKPKSALYRKHLCRVFSSLKHTCLSAASMIMFNPRFCYIGFAFISIWQFQYCQGSHNLNIMNQLSK